MMSDKKKIMILGYMALVMGLFGGIFFFFAFGPSKSMSMYMTLAVLFLIAFFHSTFMYNWKSTLAYLGIIFIVTLFYENLSIMTGFPFGHYHYSDLLRPKLLHAPIFIAPAYFSISYFPWVVSKLLLNRQGELINRTTVFTIPIMATFLFVMFDLIIDPYASTIKGFYVWENGGAYFGVPFSNYAGWFLCNYTFYQLFAFYLFKRQDSTLPSITRHPRFWLMPSILYGFMGSVVIILFFTAPRVQVESLDGHVWQSGNIYQALTLVYLLTMLPAAILAVLRTLEMKKVRVSP